MKRNNLTTFDDTDYIDEVKDVMGIKRYRDFPILDDDGKYVGMISRRNLLGAKGRKVILVDHNERSQSATGIEYAEILEIIDHHRIGAVETMGPVFFRNQPLGCTSTIIYQMYLEANAEIDKTTAGLLCSAILSDTLMFRSPTCTESDKAAAESLAQIADIDIKEYAEKMFSAGGNLKKKSVDKIFHQDFKKFKTGEITFGVGQVVSMNKGELHELAERMRPYLQEAKKEYSLDMIFFMMINIFTEVSEIIYEGEGARTVLNRGFSDIISSEKSEEEREEESSHIITLPGVLSRKKQLVPNLMIALNDE